MTFLNKHKVLKYFLGFFLFFFSVLMITIIQTIIFEGSITIFLLLKMILNNFILALIFSFIFIIPIYLISLAKHQGQKYHLDKEDFGHYKSYYRDIIDNYSPAILSYIDDYQITNKDLIATILNLELKKYISIDKNNKITILNNNFTNLSKSEEYILKNLNDLNKISYYNWLILIQEEAKNKGLITNNKKNKKHLFALIATFILISLDLIVLFMTKSILKVFFLMLFLFPIYGVTIYFYLSSVNQQHYTRSKLGNEINLKLEGLKNFLKDFSILDERDKKEIILWKEYLIFSVMFNQNENIIKELSKSLNIK